MGICQEVCLAPESCVDPSSGKCLINFCYESNELITGYTSDICMISLIDIPFCRYKINNNCYLCENDYVLFDNSVGFHCIPAKDCYQLASQKNVEIKGQTGLNF